MTPGAKELIKLHAVVMILVQDVEQRSKLVIFEGGVEFLHPSDKFSFGESR